MENILLRDVCWSIIDGVTSRSQIKDRQTLTVSGDFEYIRWQTLLARRASPCRSWCRKAPEELSLVDKRTLMGNLRELNYPESWTYPGFWRLCSRGHNAKAAVLGVYCACQAWLEARAPLTLLNISRLTVDLVGVLTLKMRIVIWAFSPCCARCVRTLVEISFESALSAVQRVQFFWSTQSWSGLSFSGTFSSSKKSERAWSTCLSPRNQYNPGEGLKLCSALN